MRRNCLWVENFQLVARFSLDQRIFCTNVSKLIFSIYFIIKLYQRCRKNWSSFCGGDEKMSEENSDAICQIPFNHVTSPRRFLNKFSHVLNLDDHNTWSEEKNCLWPAYYSARRKWIFFPTPLLNKATRGETEVEKNRRVACRQVKLRNVFSMFEKLDAVVICFWIYLLFLRLLIFHSKLASILKNFWWIVYKFIFFWIDLVNLKKIKVLRKIVIFLENFIVWHRV